MSKAYHYYVYNTRHCRDVNLCFIFIFRSNGSKKYLQDSLDYIHKNKEELLTDFRFSMNMGKVRFSKFIRANVLWNNKSTLPLKDYNKKDE